MSPPFFNLPPRLFPSLSALLLTYKRSAHTKRRSSFHHHRLLPCLFSRSPPSKETPVIPHPIPLILFPLAQFLYHFSHSPPNYPILFFCRFRLFHQCSGDDRPATIPFNFMTHTHKKKRKKMNQCCHSSSILFFFSWFPLYIPHFTSNI